MKFILHTTMIWAAAALCACNVAPPEPIQSSEFYADGEVDTLHVHTKGNGIPIVIIGDGFNHEDLRHGGNWKKAADFLTTQFLNLEVYKDFQDYFDIYAYMAESEDRGVTAGTKTKFGTNGSLANTDHALAKSLITAMPQITDITKVSVMFVCNGSMGNGIGTAMLEEDGYGYAVYSAAEPNAPYWCAHEFGGHVFGWVIDEICGGGAVVDEPFKEKLLHHQSLGKYLNVSLSADTAQAPWKQFFDVPGYDNVGIYEGGYYICENIWRSEDHSIMVNQQYAHYNAQSRYLIYKRIKTLAGESFTFDNFLDYDVKNLWQD
ncbi:MAG: M64 family metallopeptidase [Prevotellaceae bacterium]|jgi:hypothetical protein|nr:M64 family metallopeptidase [Prevotellaceae bacterium]